MQRTALLWGAAVLLLAATQVVTAQSDATPSVLSGTLQLVSRSPDTFQVTLASAPEIRSPKNPVVMVAFYDGARHDGGSGTSYWAGQTVTTVSFGAYGIPRQTRDLVLFLDQNGDYLPQENEPQAKLKAVTPETLQAPLPFLWTVEAVGPQTPQVAAPVAAPVVVAADDPTGAVEIRLAAVSANSNKMEVVLSRLPLNLTEGSADLVALWTVYGRGNFTTRTALQAKQGRYELFIPPEVETQLDQFDLFIDAKKTGRPDGQQQSWTLPGVTYAGIRSGLKFTVDWTNPMATGKPKGTFAERLAALALEYPDYQDIGGLTPVTLLDPLVGKWARVDNPEIQVEFSVSKTKVPVFGSKNFSSTFVYRFNTDPKRNPNNVLPPKGKAVGLQVWKKTVNGGDASPNDTGKLVALWFSDLWVSFQVGFNKAGQLVITEDGSHAGDSRLYSDYATLYNDNLYNPADAKNRVGVFVRVQP